jgi:hypothetical protein
VFEIGLGAVTERPRIADISPDSDGRKIVLMFQTLPQLCNLDFFSFFHVIYPEIPGVREVRGENSHRHRKAVLEH